MEVGLLAAPCCTPLLGPPKDWARAPRLRALLSDLAALHPRGAYPRPLHFNPLQPALRAHTAAGSAGWHP